MPSGVNTSIRPAMFGGTAVRSRAKALAASSRVGIVSSGGARGRTAEGRDNLLPEQLDRAHDLIVGNAAGLHEADHLIDAGRFVHAHGADARLGVADAVGAVFEQMAEVLRRLRPRFLAQPRVVLVAGNALPAPVAEQRAEHVRVPERRRPAD